MTEALNLEFEPHDIWVCDVMAMYVKTPMVTDADVTATNLDRLGVHTTAEEVARVIWKAAHGKRVHWQVGLTLKLLTFLNWAFPLTRRMTARSVNMPKP